MLDKDVIADDPMAGDLDEQGRILKRFAGEPKPGTSEELFATIDRSLTKNMNPVATK